MNLRFPESEIGYWANRYTKRQREKDSVKEQELIDLTPNVLRRGYLTKQESHTIARWKSHRRAALTLENTDDFIKEITERAFAATDDWTKLLTSTQFKVSDNRPRPQSYTSMMKETTPSLIYTPFGLSDDSGKKSFISVLVGLY